MKLLFISDFTEAYAYGLMKGIVNYSREHGNWEICRMPPAYKKSIGLKGLLEWCRNWGADAIIGLFEQNEQLSLLTDNGIVVVAQDYKRRFSTISNITADYYSNGVNAANYYLGKNFRNFAFFGYKDVCWSDERCLGFKETLINSGCCDFFSSYQKQDIDNPWDFDRDALLNWLDNLHRPVAIFACDDNQGSILVDACNSTDVRIPAEVAVLGVDNDETVCNLNTPTLSSIDVDVEAGGYEVAKVVDLLVQEKSFRRQDIILKQGKVVSRISTASFATTDEQIQKAILFIHQNIHRRLSVKDVLDNIPLSRRLLERRFKSVTGEAVYQYISRIRIKTFADMLLESNEPIINVIINMGENDTKTMARRFKQEYGCTPMEWRERHKKNNRI